MAYNVFWHEQTIDDLRSFGRTTSGNIVERIKNHLLLDPEKLGKPLKGVLKGFYRYRWGDYRIIFTIDKAEGRISVLRIGHRKDIYR